MQHIMIDLEMNKIEKQWRGKNKLSSELIEMEPYEWTITLRWWIHTRAM